MGKLDSNVQSPTAPPARNVACSRSRRLPEAAAAALAAAVRASADALASTPAGNAAPPEETPAASSLGVAVHVDPFESKGLKP